jgi:hypothetical protein
MVVARESGRSLQVEVARRKGDRRWAIQLGGGEMVYLEKAGLSYLMVPSRKQYAELPLGSLAFSGSEALTPTAMVEKLSRFPAEKQGKASINGVMAIKHQVDRQSGTPDLIFIDEGSGLPVHIEADLKELNGETGRSVVDTSNIRLNPDSALFDIPAGTKKVSPEAMKPQIVSLVAVLNEMAVMMGERAASQPARAGSTQTSNRNASRVPSSPRGGASGGGPIKLR